MCRAIHNALGAKGRRNWHTIHVYDRVRVPDVVAQKRDQVLMVVVGVKRAIWAKLRAIKSKGAENVKGKSKRNVCELSNVLGFV